MLQYLLDHVRMLDSCPEPVEETATSYNVPPHVQRTISMSNTRFNNCALRIFPDAWCGYAASSLRAAIAGSLAIGQPADNCIFVPKAFWTVTAQTLRSQRKNLPYLRRQLEGRITHTLVNGALVFQA